MPEPPKVNPYNFVPLGDRPGREPYPGLDRLDEERYSGSLACELEAMSPLFTADHRTAVDDEAGAGKKRKLFRFLRETPEGPPIIQGSSLRGMVRSVFEAATGSCLPLVAVTGTSRKAGDPVDYSFAGAGEHEVCRDSGALCPACRLFGVIQGDEVHARGRLSFSDARLDAGCALEQARIELVELSGPKPHHAGIYARDGRPGGPIAGRKFYYHQDRVAEPGHRSPRANDIAEYAASGTRFTFTVSFQNLSQDELAGLRYCLELEPGLGHKLGMAKPLGYGSCVIRLKEAECVVHRGAGRYRRWGGELEKTAVPARKPETFPDSLRELLRIDKQKGKAVGYLPWKDYQDAGIDADGEYTSHRQERPQESLESENASVGGQPFGGVVAAALEKAKPKSRNSQKKTVNIKPGAKVKVEVTAIEQGEYVLRVKPTGQEGLRFRPLARWEVGGTYTVKVVKLDEEGGVKKVKL